MSRECRCACRTGKGGVLTALCQFHGDVVRTAVEREQEACAQLADNVAVIHFAETMDGNEASRTATRLAAAIRSRGR